jgi:REP element-mobilizing transposase RayT
MSASHEPRTPPAPSGYFITFRTYGTWLHGEDKPSVNDRRNEFATPMLGRMSALAEHERSLMKHGAVLLTQAQRDIVAVTIREVCRHRGWEALAVNARTNHAHVVVVAGSDTPERMLGDFKRWATRRLREAGHFTGEMRLWAGHGSTRWLWSNESVANAIDYVLNGQ